MNFIKTINITAIMVFGFTLIVGCNNSSDPKPDSSVVEPALAQPCQIPTKVGETINQYDENGKLIRTCQGDTITNYQYDASGNILSITH
jgi:YD repeat-containing protein